jgi:glycosyltransferase involved in cell wall biosynthesis
MLGANQVKVIPNGIDTSVFRPGDRAAARRQIGLPLDTLIVLFSANGMRRNPYKDYGTLEAACQRLSGRLGRRFLCVCLGARDEEPAPAFMRLVPFLKDPSEVATYHQAADVYVHAAKQEVFGKTITESLACGNPVVATDVGGISEQIREGQTGFLTPAGDAEAIAERATRLLEDEPLRRRMGQAAAGDAKARFSLERQADSFLAWYPEVIADWKAWRAQCPEPT